MKQSELRTRIAEALDDADNIFWSETQLNRSIDEAAQVIAEECHTVRRSAHFSLRQGTTFYWLASIAQDIMIPYRLFSMTDNRRLTATSINELDQHDENWLVTSGPPQVWFPVSWDYFGVYPRTVTAGGLVYMDYIAWPRDLLDDDDEPEVPEASNEALTWFGIYEGHLKQWDAHNAVQFLTQFLELQQKNKARSGINRVQERSFHRTGVNFPSMIRGG